MKLRPSHINEFHWDEWVNKSAVDPDLTSLNVVSLSGYEPLDYLLYGLPNSERRNDGRLRNKWLKRYAHTEPGGWWCNGVNVLTSEDSQWGQFKPNEPYTYKIEKLSPGSKTKAIKYEAPARVPTEAIALKVTHSISSDIKGNHFEDEFLKRISSQNLRTNTEDLARESDVAVSPRCRRSRILDVGERE